MLLPSSSIFDRMYTILKGECFLGSPTLDKNTQVDFLKQRLNMFLETLDTINPEDTDLEDIDRLIAMIDEIDVKVQEFKISEK